MKNPAFKTAAIIPARYASTRFPGKPLVDINGVSMIMRTYGQVVSSDVFDVVAVATDDKRIFDHVIEQKGVAVMTSDNHISGTDRVLEAAENLLPQIGFNENDLVVNVQGDEPFINPQQIKALVSLFRDSEIELATQAKKITVSEELFSPNCVKVVTDLRGRAKFFSRQAIPFIRDVDSDDWLKSYNYLKHYGIYAYRFGVLKKISALAPSLLEKAESLEQLRWLENGFEIFVDETSFESISVDTPDDLSKIINTLHKE